MAALRDDFGSVRPIRRLNRLTQALLAIALAVVVNFLLRCRSSVSATTSPRTVVTHSRLNPLRPSGPRVVGVRSASVAIKVG